MHFIIIFVVVCSQRDLKETLEALHVDVSRDQMDQGSHNQSHDQVISLDRGSHDQEEESHDQVASQDEVMSTSSADAVVAEERSHDPEEEGEGSHDRSHDQSEGAASTSTAEARAAAAAGVTLAQHNIIQALEGEGHVSTDLCRE